MPSISLLAFIAFNLLPKAPLTVYTALGRQRAAAMNDEARKRKPSSANYKSRTIAAAKVGESYFPFLK
jgi:hypothetical protein